MFLPCVIFPWREDEYVPFCYGIKQAVAGDSCGYNDTSYLIVHDEIKGVWKAAPWKLGMRCVYRLCLLSPNWIRDQFLHHYWEWQGSLTKAHDLELQGSRGIFLHPSMPCQNLANAICRARSLFYTHLRAKVRKIIDICKFIFVFCAFLLLRTLRLLSAYSPRPFRVISASCPRSFLRTLRLLAAFSPAGPKGCSKDDERVLKGCLCLCHPSHNLFFRRKHLHGIILFPKFSAKILLFFDICKFCSSVLL